MDEEQFFQNFIQGSTTTGNVHSYQSAVDESTSPSRPASVSRAGTAGSASATLAAGPGPIPMYNFETAISESMGHLNLTRSVSDATSVQEILTQQSSSSSFTSALTTDSLARQNLNGNGAGVGVGHGHGLGHGLGFGSLQQQQYQQMSCSSQDYNDEMDMLGMTAALATPVTSLASSPAPSFPLNYSLNTNGNANGNGNGNVNGNTHTNNNNSTGITNAINASTTPNTTVIPDYVSSEIHNAARVTDWKNVISLASTHPHLASYKCDSGLTALHHACTRRCPLSSVFQALIQAYPEAIMDRDDQKGWTPLHHACRFKCPTECVKLLLHSYPGYGRHAAKIRDRGKGRTPLYYAFRYDAPDGVVELLLECMDRNDILDYDRDGRSALGLVWDSWITSYEGKRIMKYYNKIFEQWREQRQAFSNDDEEKLEKWWNQALDDSRRLREKFDGKVKKQWKHVNKILRGAFHFDLQDLDSSKHGKFSESENDDIDGGFIDGDSNCLQRHQFNSRKWRVLHAAVAIQCHPTLVIMACVLHPEQARELDQDDLISSSNAFQKNLHENANVKVNLYTALHLAARAPTCGQESKSALDHVLTLYPQAASIPNSADNSLPLHYLCENEFKKHWVNDGIQNVYNINVSAATHQDFMGRTPLHCACATTLCEQETDSVYAVPPAPSFLGSPQRPTHASLTRSVSGGTAPDGSLGARDSISTVEDPVGSIIQNILSAHGEVASVRDLSGKLPFHSIAECAEDWDRNVQAVYDAYPRALSQREESSNSLPLHLVSSNLDAKPRLIAKIVEYHPRAASLGNGNGRLPLHLACEAGKSWNGGLKEIFDVYRNAINIPEESGFGWLPLHFVVSSPHSSLETIEKILELSPDDVGSRTDNLGRTPLHLVVESGKGWDDGASLLFQLFPDSIAVQDNEGKIPLATALLSYCSNNVPIAPAVATEDDDDDDDDSEEENLTPQDYDNRHVEVGDFGVLGEQHLSQVNVLYHLLKAAPHVLNNNY